VLAAMLLALEKMLRLFDLVVAEGGPVTAVWRMLANLIPEYLGLGVPIGLMLGILLAFRRLALSSELDALRGAGLGFGRLLRVPYLYAVLLLGVNLFLIGFLQPRAEYGYEQVRFELKSGALGASIKVGDFTRLGRSATLRVERSENEGTDLYGVFLRLDRSGGRSIAVSADRGTFLSAGDSDAIIFRLEGGRLVHDAPSFRSPRVLSFTRYDLPIELPAIAAFRRRGNGSEELTLPELAFLADSPATPEQRRNQVRANYHFRMVEVAMILLLPLLAVALAVPPKRSSSGLGIFLSIVLVVTFHKFAQYGEQMGALGRIDPIVALWTPFALFAAMILWMYWTLAHKPGGQPIGGLERLAAVLAARIRRLTGRRASA